MLKEHIHLLVTQLLRTLILLSCIFFSISIFSQQSAVQVTTQFYPPYSLKLSDYATATDEKLAIQLLLTDITEVNRSVRLRMYVEGSGVKIKSLDFPTGETPIFLDGGFPVRLTNLDVAYLFKLENLQGISADAYSKSLPEGLYQFCFEVYDAITNVRISQRSCTPIYLVQNDPPILNLPSRGEIVTQRDVQNIIFQWTPRHLNATNVEYEFTLKELWDNYADPQSAFQSSAPLYQTTSLSPTFLYGPSEPQLLPNKRYGWQVRAVSKTGISENAVFKNNGYSEIFYFIYSADCNVPQFLLSEAESITKVKVMWQADANQTKFNVQYRKKGVKDAVWFERAVQNIEEANLYNLQADTWYEFRVGSNCVANFTGVDVQYTYSDIAAFKTPKKGGDSTYNCGYVPKIEITNREPLPNIGVNEVFTAGDFPVTVKFVEGQNGNFKGWGYIVVPYLADTKLKVLFNNIKINTDYQLINGMVLTTYDPTWSNVDDIQDEIEAFEEVLEQLLSLLSNFTGASEQIEQVDSYASKLSSSIRAMDNDSDLPQDVREELANLSNSVKQYSADLVADARSHGPDASGYYENNSNMQNTKNAFSEIRKLRNKINETRDLWFKLILAMKSLDGNAALKCIKCDYSDSDQELLDSPNRVIRFNNFGSRTNYISCVLASNFDNDDINEFFSRFDGSLFNVTEEIKAELNDEYSLLGSLIKSRDKFLAIKTNSGSITECNTPLSFSLDFCNKDKTTVSAEDKEKLIQELEHCNLTTATENIANAVTFKSDKPIDFDNLVGKINKQLSNNFYNDVKTFVDISTVSGDKTATIGSLNVNSISDADHVFKIQVDESNNKVTIATVISSTWLNNYVVNIEEEARKRGIEIDVEELRQEVILELQQLNQNTTWAEFINGLESLFNDKIATFIEATRTTRKIAQHVWEKVKLPQDLWYANNGANLAHKKWPEYVQMAPVVGGLEDGLIDEIVGIKETLVMVSELCTNDEKQEEFKNLFTSKGLSAMQKGFKDTFVELANDGEKLEHFTSKSTVQVASMFVPGGIITKGSKFNTVVNKSVKLLEEFTNPKLAAILKKIRKTRTASAKDLKLVQAVESFLKEIDPKLLERMTKIPNFEKVISEMSQTWKKYHGGKFILKHLEGKEDNFLESIASFESKIDDLTNFTADIIRKNKTGDIIGYLEYKSWKVSSFRYLQGEQALKQFKKYLEKGNFEYIFDKNKLLKEITNPEIFVKGKFQEIFKKHANDIWSINENFAKKFKLPNGKNVRTLREFKELVKDNNFWKQLDFIKLE